MAHNALPPPRRALCTRALCDHTLRPGALHVGALHVGGAPSGGLIAGVSGPDAPDPGTDLHAGSLARLATALLALSPSRRAACTRALCGRSCVLELFARALSMLAAPPAVVYELASQALMLRTRSSSSCRHPRPTDQGSPSSVSSANRDMQCARGPCAARGSTLDSDLELSGPCWRSPGWRRSQLGAGIPGLDAHDPTPLSVSAARSDWSLLTKLCLLRAVPCV